MKQVYIASYFRSGYSPVLNTGFMKFVHDVFDHPQREGIEKRLEVIQFCDEFGFKATRLAFDQSRSTIDLWKQKLKQPRIKYGVSALAPGDSTPQRKRQRIVPPFIERFILAYRVAQPGVDKTSITPALTTACNLAGIKKETETERLRTSPAWRPASDGHHSYL